MRLIDADKIKQNVTNEMLKDELNSPVYCMLECVIADIDNQPTAYDVDKVVRKLEKGIEESALVTLKAAFKEAIDIVKSGGIE